jgi:hypothetical protein
VDLKEICINTRIGIIGDPPVNAALNLRIPQPMELINYLFYAINDKIKLQSVLSQ